MRVFLNRFQAKGMDVGVSDETLNGVPIEESTSEEEPEEEDDGIDGEDADLVRAKKVQKEKPFHFTGMSDVKNRWEHGVEQGKDERREERKQEIQTIRSRLFMVVYFSRVVTCCDCCVFLGQTRQNEGGVPAGGFRSGKCEEISSHNTDRSVRYKNVERAFRKG